MKVRATVVLMLGVLAAALAGCGEVRPPFQKERVFEPTAYPQDFAVVIDESKDTYYARQDVRQVVTAEDLMSRTTYTTRRDFNDTVANSYTNAYAVTPEQLQAMWNEVQREGLMEGGKAWYFWKSHSDNYRRNERVLQIRANGKTVEFTTLNHWGYKLRPLATRVEAARFPSAAGGDPVPAKAPVVVEPAGTMPATTGPSLDELPSIVPVETQPGTAPATQGAAVGNPGAKAAGHVGADRNDVQFHDAHVEWSRQPAITHEQGDAIFAPAATVPATQP